MTAIKLLSILDRRGIRLEVHGDRLRFWPRSAVTPELANKLRQFKAEIMAVVEERQRCQSLHHVPDSWRDEAPFNGRIKTVCRLCGQFIGYRPLKPSRN